MDRKDTGHNISHVPHHLLHEGVLPVDILPGRNFLCRISPADAPDSASNMRAWKVSPFGIEVVDDRLELPIGKSFRLHIDHNGRQQKLFATAIHSYTDRSRRLVCLRFAKRLDGTSDQKLRSTIRWTCDSFYAPTVETCLDGSFRTITYLRATELSLTGLGLMTSTRNRKLSPGTHLEAKVSFPLGAKIDVKLLIKYVNWVDKNDKPYLMVGVELTGGMKDYQLHAGQYLLEFGSSEGQAPSPKALRDSGFNTKTQGSRLELSYVRSQEEFREILNLRALSFGQSDEGRQWEKWSDKYDAHARILVGRFRGQIVCSGRIVYQETIANLEQSSFVKMPDIIPRDAPLTEVGRVCTHPLYRGDDLLVQLFRFVVLTMMESGQRYMIVNCTDELLRMYETVGLRKTGASFIHPNDGAQHHLIFSDLHRTIFGVDIHPIKWMVMIGEIWDDLLPYLPESSTPFERLQLRLLLSARPALKILAEFARKHRRGRPPGHKAPPVTTSPSSKEQPHD